MVEFLEKKIHPVPGKVVNTSGNVLGEHKGVFYYTIGQRKGLDIGGQKEPIFVVKKDLEKNEIMVGTKDDLELYSDELVMGNVNIISRATVNRISTEGVFKAHCKIRYRQADQKCKVERLSTEGLSPLKYRVKFKEKQRAIAQGQICAIYIGDELVMSGVIE